MWALGGEQGGWLVSLRQLQFKEKKCAGNVITRRQCEDEAEPPVQQEKPVGLGNILWISPRFCSFAHSSLVLSPPPLSLLLF